MKRSSEREQFLHDILITFAEGGIQMIGDLLETKDREGAIGYASLTVQYEEEDTHEVSIETIASAFSKLTKDSVDYLSESNRKRLLQLSRENDAGNIDAVDATNLVEIGIFGRVEYA